MPIGSAMSFYNNLQSLKNNKFLFSGKKKKNEKDHHSFDCPFGNLSYFHGYP
jgi:hypothetical protein